MTYINADCLAEIAYRDRKIPLRPVINKAQEGIKL
jgi:hypothetical protein